MSEIRLHAVRDEPYANVDEAVTDLVTFQAAWSEARDAAELWVYSAVGGRAPRPFRIDDKFGAALAQVEVPPLGVPRAATHVLTLLDARRAGRRLGGVVLAVACERPGMVLDVRIHRGASARTAASLARAVARFTSTCTLRVVDAGRVVSEHLVASASSRLAGPAPSPVMEVPERQPGRALPTYLAPQARYMSTPTDEGTERMPADDEVRRLIAEAEPRFAFAHARSNPSPAPPSASASGDSSGDGDTAVLQSPFRAQGPLLPFTALSDSTKRRQGY